MAASSAQVECSGTKAVRSQPIAKIRNLINPQHRFLTRHTARAKIRALGEALGSPIKQSIP
jgi:hypothetical protein